MFELNEDRCYYIQEQGVDLSGDGMGIICLFHLGEGDGLSKHPPSRLFEPML